MEKFIVYILYSEKLDKYYIGYTSDLPGRLRRHNSSKRGFSALGVPWVVVYREELGGKKSAIKRELQLKGWKNRTRLEYLIRKSSEHPDFQSGGS